MIIEHATPKKLEELEASGLRFLAHSSNGSFDVISYIAKRNGRKVYGYYDHTKKAYIEVPC